MTARETLVAGLRLACPSAWIIDPPTAEVLTATTVLVEQTTIASLPAAPIARVEVAFELEVTSQYSDKAGGSRALDDDIIDLLIAFRALKLRFDPAVKSTENNRISYTTTVYVHAKKEPTDG